MIEEALETVGLRPEETLGRYPHQLSGGQRQRVMIARALILKPRIILADEPVSMIDASLRATVLGSLQRLKEEFGISILYITHDLTTAYQIGDNIIVLYRGSVAEAGERGSGRPERPSIRIPDCSSARFRFRTRTIHGLPRLRRPSPTRKAAATSCKFVDRCPAAMKKCLQQRPPLYQTDPHRAVACFLYEQSPALRTEEMDNVFRTNGRD